MKLPVANRQSPTGCEGSCCGARRSYGQRSCGFTLLEVIVACAIFFLVAFAVLELVARGLAAARSLEQREPDAGMLAGMTALETRLVEGSGSGDFEELYPNLYPGYTWLSETNEIGSNSLFQVDYAVIHDAKKRGVSETHMSILLFRPGSPPGSATKGMGR